MSQCTALITGGSGFAGLHLANHLIASGDTVVITQLSESASSSPLEVARAARVDTSVQSVKLDVTRLEEVRRVLQQIKPDVIYHLAGISFLPQAEEAEAEVYHINAMGVRNILSVASEECPHARVLYVSSSAAYGMPREGGLPLTEESELRPYSVYGASKAAGEMVATSYALRNAIDVITVRPFTHVGPYQEERFSLSGFAKQFASMKLKMEATVLNVGNLHVRRDFSHVTDIVRGYRSAVMKGRSGEVYNLCSGESHALTEVIAMLQDISGISPRIETEETRVRAIDLPDHFGSYDKATTDFSWRPQISLHESLSELFEFWVSFLEKERG